MNITKISTKTLREELEKRIEQIEKTNDEFVLVFGSIGNDSGTPFVEIFKEIKFESDLDFLQTYSLRTRFNTHRDYKGFYFKTNKFKQLKQSLNANNEQFANWILSTNSIKFCKL